MSPKFEHEPGILEMHREDLRQLVAVSARFENIDMGHGINEIKRQLAAQVAIPPEASIEFGGLYQQQQESFRNLAMVLLMALVLVFAVLILEFKDFLKPLAILAGSVLGHVRGRRGLVADRHDAEHHFLPGSDHRHWHHRQERHPDARLRRAPDGTWSVARRRR